ncbi:MAG TPA: ferritin family protein [Syntrophales bacterium]|nr:ferritin family protein [Syntrophales bacterium]HOU76858.1 ferritin family protein [Syntrophales bacterium]HPC31627.1 ferritin family protein [Syntrophales bacterium]HQG35447.1 ferritin family protein [Syntrophales bacterium]HQI36504.1 ferritin family protein [Syntrophales bacterium]
MKDRLNTLEVALNNELREHEFYLKNAERTRNSLGRAMFLQIAAEELEHHERLRQLHEKWAKDEKWPETIPLQVKETRVRDVLKGVVKEAGKAPAGDADDLKALETAIDFEGQGATYYARLRDSVTDPREKAFFELMANIEHEHYVSLKDTEEYLKDPAAWYRKTERSGLDGA